MQRVTAILSFYCTDMGISLERMGESDPRVLDIVTAGYCLVSFPVLRDDRGSGDETRNCYTAECLRVQSY